MQVNVEKQPKSTLKITIKVEAEKVKEAYEKVISKAIEETAIEGFRKGKAPKEMVLEKVGVSNLYGDVINNLLQVFYPQALKEKMISPVSNPKVEIKEFDIDKDFEFTATVATRPDVKVGNYLDELKKSYTSRIETQKKENEDKIKKGEKIDEKHIHVSPNEVIDALVKNSELEVPDILVDEESERMLSRLVDQAQSIGLSLEQYLKSQGKTSDQLRADYNKIAERSIKAEFVMGQLIRDRNVEIEDKDIEAALKASGLENIEEKKNNIYEKLYIKSVLQKNKLLSDIIEEVEGGNHHEHKEK